MTIMTDKIFNRFEIEIKKAYYVYERYKSVSSFILLHHEKPLSVVELSNFLRISDQFLEINENVYFINLTFTEEEGAFKAAENLLLNLDKHFNSRDTYIAMEALDTANSPMMIINKLNLILKETKEHSYSRIEDESILNEIF